MNGEPRAAEFPQVILWGDYPDPSILRVGRDYYMTHSPFVYAPGFLIWHSTDLVHWKPMARVLPGFVGSSFAPDLVRVGEIFYLYFAAAGANWVNSAPRIEGPWSSPVTYFDGREEADLESQDCGKEKARSQAMRSRRRSIRLPPAIPMRCMMP